MTLYVPSKLVEEARRRGFDVESLVVDLLVRTLNLDPQVAGEAHLELSLKYLVLSTPFQLHVPDSCGHEGPSSPFSPAMNGIQSYTV